jgi:hypothetical protein
VVPGLLQGDGVRTETASDAFGAFEFDGLTQKAAYPVSIEYPGHVSQALDVRTDTDVTSASSA